LINPYNFFSPAPSAPSALQGTLASGVLTVTSVTGKVYPGLKMTLGAATFYVRAQLTATTAGTNAGTGTYSVSDLSTTVSSATDATDFSVADASACTCKSINFAGPYDTATLKSGAAGGRIVSYGLSCEYTGKVVDMGGTYYMYSTADHSNLNIVKPADYLGASSETLVSRLDKKKQWLVCSSLDEGEMSYVDRVEQITSPTSILSEYSYPYSNRQPLWNGSTFGGSPLLIIADAPAATTFEVEAVAHVEYIGRSAQAHLTPTHSDARGFEIVASASAMIPQLRTAAPNVALPSLMNKAISMAMDSLAPVAHYGLQRMGVAGARYLANRLGVGGPLGSQMGALRLT